MPMMPYILCGVPSCEYYTQPIWLPFPTPPETTGDRPPWPKDGWRAYILCPGCGKLALRKRESVTWEELKPSALVGLLSTRAWFYLICECAEPTCKTAIQVSIEAQRQASFEDLVKEFQKGGFEARMSCGHRPLIPSERQAYQLYGPIPSYG